MNTLKMLISSSCMVIVSICYFTEIVKGNAIKTAAVFGGGAAGLTAAMELKEAGFDVHLYEKDGRFGGKMIGYVDRNGYAREHCIRISTFKYLAFGDVMDRLGLKPPTIADHDSSTFSELNLTLMGSQTGFAISNQEVAGKMIEMGFSPMEYQYFVYQLIAWQSVPAAQRNALFKVQFRNFINDFAFEQWRDRTNCTPNLVDPTATYCLPVHTPRFHSFLETVMGIALAAKPQDSVPGVMRVLQFLNPSHMSHVSEECLPYYKYFPASYLIKGPTSTAVVDPWVSYIKSLGVKLHKKYELIKLQKAPSSNSIKSARVKTKSGMIETIKADAFIMALPVDNAEDIEPGITQGTADVTAWSSGVMFYLPCLPDSWQVMRNSTPLTMMWDSRYHIVFTLQSPDDGTWNGVDVTFKEGIEYVLSLGMSEFEEPGINGKTVLESTRKELLSEILAQITLPTSVTCPNGFTYDHRSLIRTAKLGLLFNNVKEEVYQQKKRDKYRTAKVGPLKEDGRRWIIESPLFLPTPDALTVSPTTKYGNLFLAGEYVSSPLVNMPNMEHVVETAKLAAQAAIEALGVDYSVPTVDMLLRLVNATTVAEYGEKVNDGIFKGGC